MCTTSCTATASMQCRLPSNQSQQRQPVDQLATVQHERGGAASSMIIMSSIRHGDLMLAAHPYSLWVMDAAIQTNLQGLRPFGHGPPCADTYRAGQVSPRILFF